MKPIKKKTSAQIKKMQSSTAAPCNPSKLTSRSLKLAWVSAVIAVLSVFGHRFAVIDFQPALLGIVISVLIGLTAIVAGLVGTLRAIKAEQPEIASTTAGSTLGFLVVAPVIVTLLAGAGKPRIHDITTDFDHPPEFVAIKQLRTGAHNSLDRLEPENLVVLQREGYPDIAPLLTDEPLSRVFDRAVALAEKRGWEIVSASVAAGRIEAVSTTPVMGFKDDVVIRIQREGQRTRIDMRSVSRVGKGDLGVNAERIRSFLADLNP